MAIKRNEARRISADGARAGATVLGGRLVKEGDRYIINKTDVTDLLETLIEQNVVLVVSAVRDEEKARVRTCLTCGDEFTGSECPRCARIRSRLRG